MSPGNALQAAAGQDWSPFVLVAGLLLIGLMANDDGLFAWAGDRIAALARNGFALFAGASALISVVTAVLNLDTSVAFLTPVLVYAARARVRSDVALLYGCVLLSNAASLLLPGSNLTNLIVLGHLHLSGGAFAARMGLPWVAAVATTAVIVGIGGRDSLRTRPEPATGDAELHLGLGAAAMAAAVLVVLGLRSPALPVLGIGVAGVALRWRQGRTTATEIRNVLGLPVLTGLFLVALGLGAAGRMWSGPAQMLGRLGPWSTAGVAAAASVLVNNLPAASLLAARAPAHPYALLIGLDLGPNLFVTGSLSWILWLRSARSAGARPSLATGTAMGVVAAVVSMAAALALLEATSLA